MKMIFENMKKYANGKMRLDKVVQSERGERIGVRKVRINEIKNRELSI
jgi:hypothetical protein